ncbi:hydrolase Nlp/P60 [Pseudonocardia sulfidoxydans NBRC 16205]|uniref:Hydrolase Nlp/P60 n=1 Tax=Pseudonocardia sulfidoxydans NBRC 16205 TaxID=1223511 RepID=A0A511DNV3_9PSEU|nr:NlpC/P60 family protein [Pseudonocardia sulfidoxydans]GEL25474.1 hydrolase Nlp/P60 [Pseudonocardia sulfidoxydans NBRC 16205]
MTVVLVAAIVGAGLTAVVAGEAMADPTPPLPPGVTVPLVPPPVGSDLPPAPEVPPPPTDAAQARDQYQQAQREAEALTEQWHAATDAHDTAEADADTAREAVGPAQEAAARAEADEEQYRSQLDVMALATFENGKLDQFDALLSSTSPQNFLDQMSALESLTAEHRVQLQEFEAKVAAARQARADADAAVARAQQTADAARRTADDIKARKAAADVRITDVERMISRLGPAERATLLSPDEGAPIGIVLGSGIGAKALAMAATKLGSPYVWGASGPRSFDCSGLTSWAFEQVGMTLPRSSSAQSRIGTPVAWNDLRPGDLVFYYSPVSHVGIYAGGGKMINAPESGDVVKYQTVSRSAFSGARRL